MKLNLHYLWGAARAKQRLTTGDLCGWSLDQQAYFGVVAGNAGLGGFEEINKTVDLSTAICCVPWRSCLLIYLGPLK